MTANIIIYDSEIQINNITLLKEFSETFFNVEINNTLFSIKGSKMLLKEVFNDNKSIKISGEFYEITKVNHPKDKEKNFIKKLFF